MGGGGSQGSNDSLATMLGTNTLCEVTMANVNLGRADPPRSDWPGREVDETDVLKACGDDRDWFATSQRLEAFRKVKACFEYSRQRRKKYSYGFDWGQTLIIGDMGACKSTLTSYLSLGSHILQNKEAGYLLGHPFFSNTSYLMGNPD